MGLIEFKIANCFPAIQQDSQEIQVQFNYQVFDFETILKDQEDCQASTNSTEQHRILPEFKTQLNPFSKNHKLQVSDRIQTWNDAFTSPHIIGSLLEFLSFQELDVLRNCNRKMKKEVIIKLLRKDNNWSSTLTKMAKYYSQSNYLQQSRIEEESQHSVDLDRTSCYFEKSDGGDEDQMKLNRVITALSFRIEYFQGIMPICVTLLECFNETTTYWVMLILLSKCQNIQNDTKVYSELMEQLEEEMNRLLPALSEHFYEEDLELNYFAMKWIMGIFSEDMNRGLLLRFWDILLNTEISMLIYTVIAILEYLQDELLELDADGINNLLKTQLKSRLSIANDEQLMKKATHLYLENAFDAG